jgi:hypothetical protein
MSKIGAIAQSDTSIITDGLIYNLDFSKFSCFPRTGTTVTDLEESLTATIANGASFTSNDLGACDFDAVDDQIAINPPPGILESYPLSIEVWFKSGNNNTGIVSKGRTRGSASQRDLDITGTGTDIRFLISNGSGYNFILDATYPSLNVWHHLVCMWDGTTTTNGAKMYLDGSLYAQATSTGTSFATGDGIYIGGNRSGFFFDGPIAVTRFYNKSLSADEVSINYNALKERFGL